MAKKKTVSVHEYEQERKRVQKTARLRWARMRTANTRISLVNCNDPDTRPRPVNKEIHMAWSLGGGAGWEGFAETEKDREAFDEFFKKYGEDAKNFKYNGYVFDDE